MVLTHAGEAPARHFAGAKRRVRAFHRIRGPISRQKKCVMAGRRPQVLGLPHLSHAPHKSDAPPELHTAPYRPGAHIARPAASAHVSRFPGAPEAMPRAGRPSQKVALPSKVPGAVPLSKFERSVPGRPLPGVPHVAPRGDSHAAAAAAPTEAGGGRLAAVRTAQAQRDVRLRAAAFLQRFAFDGKLGAGTCSSVSRVRVRALKILVVNDTTHRIAARDGSAAAADAELEGPRLLVESVANTGPAAASGGSSGGGGGQPGASAAAAEANLGHPPWRAPGRTADIPADSSMAHQRSVALTETSIGLGSANDRGEPLAAAEVAVAAAAAGMGSAHAGRGPLGFETHSCCITGVPPGGPAERAQLHRYIGWRVLSVNRATRPSSDEELAEALRRASRPVSLVLVPQTKEARAAWAAAGGVETFVALKSTLLSAEPIVVAGARSEVELLRRLTIARGEAAERVGPRPDGSADFNGRFAVCGGGARFFPRLVASFDYGLDNVYAALELAEHGSLAAAPYEAAAGDARVRHFGAQMLRAVATLHRLGICHRDIRPSNILLRCRRALGDGDSEGPRDQLLRCDIRIANFGRACRVQRTRMTDGQKPVLRKGAAEAYAYAAPEMRQHASAREHGNSNVSFTRAVDLWSTGAVLYFLATGQAPDVGAPVQDAARSNDERRRGSWGFGVLALTEVLPMAESRDLLRMLLAPPQFRPTVEQAQAVVELAWEEARAVEANDVAGAGIGTGCGDTSYEVAPASAHGKEGATAAGVPSWDDVYELDALDAELRSSEQEDEQRGMSQGVPSPVESETKQQWEQGGQELGKEEEEEEKEEEEEEEAAALEKEVNEQRLLFRGGRNVVVHRRATTKSGATDTPVFCLLELHCNGGGTTKRGGVLPVEVAVGVKVPSETVLNCGASFSEAALQRLAEATRAAARVGGGSLFGQADSNSGAVRAMQRWVIGAGVTSAEHGERDGCAWVCRRCQKVCGDRYASLRQNARCADCDAELAPRRALVVEWLLAHLRLLPAEDGTCHVHINEPRPSPLTGGGVGHVASRRRDDGDGRGATPRVAALFVARPAPALEQRKQRLQPRPPASLRSSRARSPRPQLQSPSVAAHSRAAGVDATTNNMYDLAVDTETANAEAGLSHSSSPLTPHSPGTDMGDSLTVAAVTHALRHSFIRNASRTPGGSSRCGTEWPPSPPPSPPPSHPPTLALASTPSTPEPMASLSPTSAARGDAGGSILVPVAPQREASAYGFLGPTVQTFAATSAKRQYVQVGGGANFSVSAFVGN